MDEVAVRERTVLIQQRKLLKEDKISQKRKGCVDR
jgi:hypothetical protein